LATATINKLEYDQQFLHNIVIYDDGTHCLANSKAYNSVENKQISNKTKHFGQTIIF
jgi:hypothetical protein